MRIGKFCLLSFTKTLLHGFPSRSKLVIGREYPHPKENELLAEVIELTKAQMERVYKNGEAFRQVHAKSHGCVKASFTVEPGLPEHLKVGLFTNETSFPPGCGCRTGCQKFSTTINAMCAALRSSC
jgi:hypothetical protein